MPLFKRKRFDSAPIFTVGDDSFIVKRAESGSTGALLDIQDQTGTSLFRIDNAGTVQTITVAAGSIDLGTDTTGDYVQALNAGTGVTITNNSGEGANPTIAIGQAIGSGNSPTFSALTISNGASVGTSLTVGSSVIIEGTVDAHQTSIVAVDPTADRTVTLQDASGTVALLGTIALGTDTTGNYMSGISAGNGISVTHTPAEGSSATVELATVTRTDSTGSPKTQYVHSISTNSYGQVTEVAKSDLSIALGTQTTGDYVASLVAGTGVTLTNNSGETATPTIAIGQSVATDATVTFNTVNANLTGNVTGNASTASALQTARTIALSGDISGSASFDGSQAITISSTIQPNSVALGTDTTGNYVATVSGTDNQITVSGSGSEAAALTLSLPQSIATTSSVSFADVQITNNSLTANSAVTKSYVDAIAAGIDWHTAVVLATTAVLPNTPTYSNGTSGNNATLTAGANARLSIDATNANTGERVLVKNQASALQNGVYVVTDQGSASTPWILTRAEDFDGDNSHAIIGGEAVFITGGSINVRQGFIVTSAGSGTAGAHIFGTDSISFTQFTGTASFTAGSGLTQTGNTLNVGTVSSSRIVVNNDDIDLATVSQSNTTGTPGTSFVQSQTVDSYGRITGTVTAVIQDATTSVKGIASFSSSNFSVASGVVSIANNAVALGTQTTGNYMSDVSGGTGVTVTHTPGEGSTATIAIGQSVATSATPTFTSMTLSQATGTAPLTVSSTTRVSNLNADLLDDFTGAWYSPPGMISMFAGSSAPSGWLLCDGSAVSRTTFANLFTAIGTQFGSGNGSTTFNVPDLRGRVAVGLISTDTSFDTLGETGGHKELTAHTHTGPSHTHTGTTATEGAHTHAYTDYHTDGGAAVNFGSHYSVGAYTATTRTTAAGSAHSHTFTSDASGTANTGSTGNGNAGNLQPYIVLNYIIKI